MNIKYQNDSGNFCTLGDNELAHYNHNHDKLGRFARSVGTGVTNARNNAVASYVSSRYNKINKRQGKIDKFDRKINRTRNQRRLQKAQKYSYKLAKAERKAKRANIHKVAGKTLSKREVKRLMKVEKLKAKMAGKTYKTEKWTAKAQKREYRNYRDAKRVNRLVNKYGDVSMSKVKKSQKTKAVQHYLENSNQPIQRQTPYEMSYSTNNGTTTRKTETSGRKSSKYPEFGPNRSENKKEWYDYHNSSQYKKDLNSIKDPDLRDMFITEHNDFLEEKKSKRSKK